MASVRKEELTVTLQYHDGKDEPERRIFRSSVRAPKHVSELLMWVDREQEFDEAQSSSAAGERMQLNLCGSRRALYEMGCFLLAMSRFESKDPGYHEHFDEIPSPENKLSCELIVHSPSRIRESVSAKAKARDH